MSATTPALPKVEREKADAPIVWHIVVYNDDVNTFDHVINTFCEILGHTFSQAEQCATIIHEKGKCSVKNGQYEDLKPLTSHLCERKLSASLQRKSA